MRSSYTEPTVLVIGGAGYIGSVLVRKLLEEEYRVRVFDNLLFGDDGVCDLANPRFKLFEGDICDTRAVSQAIIGADIVVHLAALVGRRVEDTRRINIRDVNFLASTVVLDAALEHGASRLIFASTDSVYGTQSGVMYETGTPEPASTYSRLKLRMEERVMNAKKRSFHPTALRIATCYGYSPRMRFDLVANSLLRDAVCKRRLVIEGGEQSRALINVEDAAQAILSCVKAHVNLVSGEVFNVGASGQNYTLHQLANIIKGLVPDTEVVVEEGEADLVDYHLSCSKIEKILDFRPQWGVEESLVQVRDMLLGGQFGDPYSYRYHNT